MKRWIATGLVALGAMFGASGALHAAGAGFPMDKAPRLTNDLAALQNGAKIFTNYCLSCHSASFVRYNRLTEIGLTEKQIRENLMFTTEKVGDQMIAAIIKVTEIINLGKSGTAAGCSQVLTDRQHCFLFKFRHVNTSLFNSRKF